MLPAEVIRLLRRNPGIPLALRIRGRSGTAGTVYLKWERGGVMFYLRPLRLWDGPHAEPRALEVMAGWRIYEARPVSAGEVA